MKSVLSKAQKCGAKDHPKPKNVEAKIKSRENPGQTVDPTRESPSKTLDPKPKNVEAKIKCNTVDTKENMGSENSASPKPKAKDQVPAKYGSEVKRRMLSYYFEQFLLNQLKNLDHKPKQNTQDRYWDTTTQAKDRYFNRR